MNVYNSPSQSLFSDLDVELKRIVISYLENDWASVNQLSCVSRLFHQIVRSYGFPHLFPWSENRLTLSLTYAKALSLIFHEDSTTSFSKAELNQHKRNYLSSALLTFDNRGREYRIYKYRNPPKMLLHRELYIAEFSESTAVKKLWRVPLKIFIVNCHPIPNGFILVYENEYEIYQWDKNQNLNCLTKKYVYKGSKIKIDSSLYHNETLSLLVYDFRRDTHYVYSISERLDEISEVQKTDLEPIRIDLRDIKFSKSHKDVEFLFSKKAHHLTLLGGNQCYVDYFDEQSKERILFPLQEKHPISNTPLNPILLYKHSVNFFISDWNAYKYPPLTFGEWTIYYFETHFTVFFKNRLWIEYLPIKFFKSISTKLTGLLKPTFHVSAHLLFLHFKENFQVISLLTKKEITYLFSPLEKYLIPGVEIHFFSIKFNNTCTAEVSVCIAKWKRDESQSIAPLSDLDNDPFSAMQTQETGSFLIQFSVNLTEESPQELDHPKQPILPLSSSKEEGLDLEPFDEGNVPLNSKRRSAKNISRVADRVLNNIEHEEITKSSEEEEEEELGNSDWETNSENSACSKSPPIRLQTSETPPIREISKEDLKSLNTPFSSYNPYKVVLSVNILFVAMGVSATLILATLHPGTLLFKVHMIPITLPTTLTFSSAVINAIAALILSSIILKRRNPR